MMQTLSKEMRRLADECANFSPDGYRMVIIDSKPKKVFELHSSKFAKAPGGCLRLTSKQLISARSIRIAAAEQAMYPLLPDFDARWNGTDGTRGLLCLVMLYATKSTGGASRSK